jgi:acylphosphatase
MKVIDLLNKIAKGEEVPKELWYQGRLYKYIEDNNIVYRYAFRNSAQTLGLILMVDSLNDQVEIIEEPRLTDKEREYLKEVIKPFNVTSIRKYDWEDDEEYIEIIVEDKWAIDLPPFIKGTRYKGMELNEYYSIEELDLEED